MALEFQNHVPLAVLLHDLSVVERRRDAARALARGMGAKDLLLFLRDPDLGVLLPAPGFPQTLPDGHAWREFLDRCVAAGGEDPSAAAHGRTQTARLRSPGASSAEPVEVTGVASGRDVVLVLLGGQAKIDALGIVLPFVPLLVRSINGERAVRAADAQARVSRDAAGRAETLAQSLDVARTALEVERMRLVELFRYAPSFIVAYRGPEQRYEFVNDAYYQLIGHRDVVGKALLEALPEVRGQGFKELLDQVLETGEPWVGHETPALLQRQPGAAPEVRYLDVIFQAQVEADGTRTGVIAHGSDVTEQVRARREVERLLADSEAAREALDQANAQLQEQGLELELMNQQLHDTAAELELSNDELQCAAEVLEQRTAAAESAEAASERARREADAANQAKSVFLATMSHELRTPINAMIGYTQLIELGLAGPLTAQQRDYLTRLSASSRHLLGLVNDVLDLAKIDAGEMRVARDALLAAPAVTAALDLTRPQAAARGVRLVPPGENARTVAFVGDEHRVRQILINLLSNAIKFTPPGGTVTITCRTAEPTSPVDTLCGAGWWTYIRVEDTGIGIAPEEQGRIFEPFVQVEAGHTRTQGGTGLGLAISRRLARLMGGDLSLESTPGVGSVLTLCLPASERVRDETDQVGHTVETLGTGTTGAERHSEVATAGVEEIGEMLRDSVEDVLRAYTDRLRAEPTIPGALVMRRVQLEDHAASLLADLAQSLVIVSSAGDETADLLRDGSAIQHAIAQAHGARRFAQGWPESAVRRDQQILREEVERAVRGRLRTASTEADTALAVLLGLIDRAEELSVSAWRRAGGDRVNLPT